MWLGRFFSVAGSRQNICSVVLDEADMLLSAYESEMCVARPWRVYDWRGVFTIDVTCLRLV